MALPLTVLVPAHRTPHGAHRTGHSTAHTTRGVHDDNMYAAAAAAAAVDDDDDDGANARGRGLIGCALLASEAAADIARQCRSNPRLLSMLVQEKCDDEANRSRFAHDFKTLADVLVQHVVTKRIGRQVCYTYVISSVVRTLYSVSKIRLFALLATPS